MKQMIQRMREEKGGFTLAELLIVVAIVAVLVAIAIPVFTSQLAKAQAGTDEANCRSYYAHLAVDYMTNNTKPTAGELSELPSYEGVQEYKLQQGKFTITVASNTVTCEYKSDVEGHDWKGSFSMTPEKTEAGA